jgi:Flp pilus assembly pilin Flp
MKTRIMQTILLFRDDRRAVTIIEYTLLAALIGLALIASLTGLEGKIAAALTTIGSGL